MGLLKEITNDIWGKHPLVEIGASIEKITPYSPCGIIYEGLIKTYPIDDVINTMARVFNLEKPTKSQMSSIYSDIKTGRKLDYNGYVAKYTLNSDVIIFIVGKGSYNKETLDKYMNKYGYFCSSEKDWSPEWVRYQYEKKFDNDVTDLVKEKKFIYHICPIELKEKVLSQGLTPHKGKYPGFNNDYRLYFFIEDKGEYGFAEEAKWESRDKEQETDAYVVYEVDTSKIKQDIKFYTDPRMENAVYALQGIPPEALHIKYTILI